MNRREERGQSNPDADQAEAERARFFALSLDMLCIAGFDGYFKHLNPVWQQTLGYTVEELLSQPYMAFVHPDDHESTIAEAQNLSVGDATRPFENRYRCKDGSYNSISRRAMRLTDQPPIYATSQGVTARKAT